MILICGKRRIIQQSTSSTFYVPGCGINPRFKVPIKISWPLKKAINSKSISFYFLSIRTDVSVLKDVFVMENIVLPTNKTTFILKLI